MTIRGRTIIRIIGALLAFFSISMLPPIGVAYYFGDGSASPFWIGFVITLGTGLFLWIPTRKYHGELKTRDGFLIVTLFWTVLSLFASIPFIIGIHSHLSLVDALFISVSGFTTTGAEVLTTLNGLPHALLYYRQQLQFIGGMGIIVLAVAIMPIIGIGGMQLYRAETPGPMKDDKLTPRIMQTAKIIWLVYVGLCVSCAVIYAWCGMSWFDAICESFSTVSTGGFTIHDSSFAFYQNPAIRLTAIVFMLLGGISFSLHYAVIVQRRLRLYWQNMECRMFLLGVLVIAAGISLSLIIRQYYAVSSEAIMNAFFNTISIFTTTGFTYGSYNGWPGAIPIVLMAVGFIGACGGSTSGGLKVIRALLLQKQIAWEVKQLIHPNAIYPVKLGNKVISLEVLQSVWAFFSVYITMFTVITMLFMATGMNFESALGTTVATLANVGAGVGHHAYNFSHLTGFAKSVCIFAMLAGRLEVFTLLVIFSRGFWRR